MQSKLLPGARQPGPRAAAAPRPQLAWTDFHTVMAIAQHGSVAQACEVLGMTHSTLLRKLDQIETRMKTRLFDRTRGRYVPTAAGAEIVEAARGFEPVATATEMRVKGLDLRPHGQVRVSAASVVIEHLMEPVLVQFASAFPEIQIELASTRDHVNLRRHEADVAIRVADTVSGWLVGRKLLDLQFRIYGPAGGSRSLRPLSELTRQRRWISFERDARDLKFDRWLARRLPESSVVLRVDDFSHAARLVRAGLGIAMLPVFVEQKLEGLCPLTEPIESLATPLWLITHPELMDSMRVKVVMRAFGSALGNAATAAQLAALGH